MFTTSVTPPHSQTRGVPNTSRHPANPRTMFATSATRPSVLPAVVNAVLVAAAAEDTVALTVPPRLLCRDAA